ncbi:MAG: asparagine synthase-related protein [Spirochaetes bacterium]|nr:asparagine synthase-related protein [Spirochaetota bacterium]
MQSFTVIISRENKTCFSSIDFSKIFEVISNELNLTSNLYSITTTEKLSYEFHLISSKSNLKIRIFIDLIKNRSKLFKFSDNNLIILIYGTFLNIKDFFYKTDEENQDIILLSDKVKDYYIKNDIYTFLKSIRGAFNGIVIDNKNEEIFVFNDQIGSKPIFFSILQKEETFIFSSKLSIISNFRKKLYYKNKANLNAFYQMLSFGYLLNNDTYIEEIIKFYPGQFAFFSLNKRKTPLNINKNNLDKINLEIRTNIEEEDFKFILDRYFILKNSPIINGKIDEIIYEIFNKYIETIKLIFEYDRFIYGYFFQKSINNEKNSIKTDNFKHFTFLSGGLDSRILVGLAYKAGYKNILSINFAQSFSQDNESAQLIAEKLKIDYIFNSLNYGNYLTKNLDEILKANDGLIFFAGASHMFDTISKINLNNCGLLINGILIDGFMGGYLDLSNKKDFYKHWASSTKLIDKINNINQYIDFFETREEFNSYNRGINAITNGFRMIEFFAEFASPANDYLLSDFVFRIGQKIKFRKNIYEILKYDLIIRYLPELRWILYHNNLSPVIENKIISSIFHLLNNIKRIIINRPYFSQNPFKKWLKNNPNIINNFNKIFNLEIEKNLNILNTNKELLNDIRNLYFEGNLSEKSMTITLLKSINLHKIDIL